MRILFVQEHGPSSFTNIYKLEDFIQKCPDLWCFFQNWKIWWYWALWQAELSFKWSTLIRNMHKMSYLLCTFCKVPTPIFAGNIEKQCFWKIQSKTKMRPCPNKSLDSFSGEIRQYYHSINWDKGPNRGPDQRYHSQDIGLSRFPSPIQEKMEMYE